MRGVVPSIARDDHDVDAWAAAQVRSAAAPAFVARADGTLAAANVAAQAAFGEGTVPTVLRAAIVETRMKAQAQTVIASFADGRAFVFALLPLSGAQVLGIGREQTLETNLIAALSASRDLYRDLSLCLSDFAFETDAAGVFRWVSPGGLLGHSPASLNGVCARDVFAGLEPNPFATRVPIEGAEHWVRAKTGEESCIGISARPVVDAAGVFCGVRGIARDLTPLKLLERESRSARAREQLIGSVVDAVRAQVEPRRMMLAAADALAAATASDAVTIAIVGRNDVVRSGACAGLAHGVEFAVNHQGARNASVRLSREAAKGPYGEAEQALIAAVAPHLGIAVALALAIEGAKSSRIDAASGLLNGRAFAREAERRRSQAARRGRETVLIVADGRRVARAGEAAVAVVARAIEQTFDADGVAGRLDDGTFAVLIEGSGDATVHGEALERALQSAFAATGIDLPVPGIGCAAGAAESDEMFEDLLGRALCALAEARRAGVTNVVAHVSHEVTSC